MGTTNMDRPAWNCRSTKVCTERERRGDEWKCQDDKNTQRTHFCYFFRFGEPSIDDTKVCTCIYM